MNVAVINPAPGLPPRRAFDVNDIRRMIDVGVLREDENIELVEGEIVVVAAKSYAHERTKNAFLKALIQAAPGDFEVGAEMTIQFSHGILLEPDIVVVLTQKIRKSDANFVIVEPGGCTLIVEVAVSSLTYDMGRKAALYAKLAVQEFWVVDANERVVWIHSGPTDGGWSSIAERRAGELLTTPALPRFGIRLDDIG